MESRRRTIITYGRAKRKIASNDTTCKRRRVEIEFPDTEDSSSPAPPDLSPTESSPTLRCPTTTPPSSPPPALLPITSSKQLQPITGNARPKLPISNRPLVQMQLSLGATTQKSCRECGMTYMASSTEDVALHKAFHERTLDGIDFGRSFRKTLETCTIVARPREGELVIVVDAKSPAGLKSRANEALRLAQSELGAVRLLDSEVWSECNGKLRFRVYMYLRGARCTGVCLAERDPLVFRLLRAGEMMSHVPPPVGEYVGIARIWVSAKNRKRGVAMEMLESVRQTFIDRAVGKDFIAFSQPTDSGKRLARHWYARDDGWLVYSG